MSPRRTTSEASEASGASDFDGVVLCGGASRRMGTDKALIEVDGRPMARRVADALSAAGATTVSAVGGDVAALAAVGLAVHPDRWPGHGPLAGVIEGLRTVGSHGTVLVLACDLVSPDPQLIGALAARCSLGGADLVVPVTAGRAQWAHGAWRRRSVDALVGAFDAGERSLAGVAASLRVETLVAPTPTALRDADVPSDLPGVAYDRGVDIPEIDIETLSSKVADDAPVFDVRQPDEYEQAHIPGVRLVPLDQVPERVEEFPADGTVYVVCRTGGRSAKAVEYLRAQGVDAVNVAGGTKGWMESGKPVDTGA